MENKQVDQISDTQLTVYFDRAGFYPDPPKNARVIKDEFSIDIPIWSAKSRENWDNYMLERYGWNRHSKFKRMFADYY